jgi:predicted transcriptional regulator
MVGITEGFQTFPFFKRSIIAMTVYQRQQQIIKYMKEQRFSTVKELARVVWSSESSVRRDIKTLENAGYVRQTYGGIVLADGESDVVPVMLRDSVNSSVKEQLAKRAAEYLQTQIQQITGLELPIQEDSAVTAAYEIIVGDTEREISAKLDADTDRDGFALMSHGKQVAIEGDYFLIAAAAYYFIFFATDGENKKQTSK